MKKFLAIAFFVTLAFLSVNKASAQVYAGPGGVYINNPSAYYGYGNYGNYGYYGNMYGGYNPYNYGYGFNQFSYGGYQPNYLLASSFNQPTFYNQYYNPYNNYGFNRGYISAGFGFGW